jgi:hypothetical protein
MKSFLIAIIAIIVVAPPCRAQVEEEFIPEEPRVIVPDSMKKNLDYDVIVIGGLGIAASNDAFYKAAPTVGLGIELPLTQNHITAFQVYGHSWVTNDMDYPQGWDDIDEHYINVGNGYYSQMGISFLLKWYIGRKTSPVRFSIHFGFLLISPKNGYKESDIGFALYYRFSNNLSASAEIRIIDDWTFSLGGYVPPCYTPTIILTNLHYNFKW